jgi:tetrapyrrole methylase family protein/MazG family protein
MKDLFNLLDQIFDKCIWTSTQSTQSLKKYLIEETGEFVEALDSGDKEHMTEELGDVLFNVLFMAKAAEKEGLFTFEEVVNTLKDKMLRRNPHVFGDHKVENLEDIGLMWNSVKQAEKEAKKKRAK